MAHGVHKLEVSRFGSDFVKRHYPTLGVLFKALTYFGNLVVTEPVGLTQFSMVGATDTHPQRGSSLVESQPLPEAR
jgi:hypothetical protein